MTSIPSPGGAATTTPNDVGGSGSASATGAIAGRSDPRSTSPREVGGLGGARRRLAIAAVLAFLLSACFLLLDSRRSPGVGPSGLANEIPYLTLLAIGVLCVAAIQAALLHRGRQHAVGLLLGLFGALVAVLCVHAAATHAPAERLAIVVSCLLAGAYVVLPWGGREQALLTAASAICFALAVPWLDRSAGLAFASLVFAIAATGSIHAARAFDGHRHAARTDVERLSVESRSRLEDAEVQASLLRVAEALHQHRGETRLLERVNHLTVELLGCDFSSTFLWDDERQAFHLHANVGANPDVKIEFPLVDFPRGSMPLLDVLEPGKVLEIEDAETQTYIPVVLLKSLHVSSMLVVAIEGHGGVVGGFIHGFRDRTGPFTPQQRRLVSGIAQVSAMALDNTRLIEDYRRASELKSEFLATVSHELRTPLNVIFGNIEMMLDTPLDDEQRDFATRTKANAENLLATIDGLLDLSRIEANRLDLEFADLDLGTVVDDALSLHATAAASKGLELLRDLEPSLATRRFRGDGRRLGQILTNLLGNAVKFTDAGEIEVRVREVRRGDHGSTLRFEVLDTGIGIADEDRSRLFEAFAQAAPATNRIYGGTGLGLAICKRLVAAMKGEIGVESTPGSGSRFWFSLDLEHGEPAVVDADTSGREGSRHLHPARALVIDDHPRAAELLASRISACGLVTATAPDLERATTSAREASRAGTPFDLFLVDQGLPAAEIESLAQWLRSTPSLQGAILVGLRPPTSPNPHWRRNTLFDDVLVKPVADGPLRELLTRAPRDPAERQRRSVPESRIRVLLAEDDAVARLQTKEALEQVGVGVDLVRDGGEVVAAVERRRYDLVLLDPQIPELDGYQAAAQIRRLESGGRRTPILALVRALGAEARQRCVAAGMDDILCTPLGSATLHAVMHRWIGVRTTNEAEQTLRHSA